MNTSLHTVRALLVSSSEAQTQRISALLTRAHIVPFDHAGSARQALEQFDAGGIDGVLIPEPIAGSSGRELALQKAALHGRAAAGRTGTRGHGRRPARTVRRAGAAE